MGVQVVVRYISWFFSFTTKICTLHFLKFIKACTAAAEKGYFECLKYLHENGTEWDTSPFDAAADGGHLEILKYLYENNCQWTSSACRHAASKGHLECLKYLHSKGCPWDYQTCSAAAQHGHFECLKYALENGSEWDYNNDSGICFEHKLVRDYVNELQQKNKKLA